MNKYRIIKKTYLDGKLYYRVQYRFLFFFWVNTEKRFIYLSILPYDDHSHLEGLEHRKYLNALKEVKYLQDRDKSIKVTDSKVIELSEYRNEI